MFAGDFWIGYCGCFDSVNVIARVEDVCSRPPGWKQVTGDAVVVSAIPYYVGPWQYARRLRAITMAVRAAVAPDDAVLLRVGSAIAARLEPELRRTGRPYGVQVVGDPYEVFAPGAVRHPLRPVFRYFFSRQLRRQCAGARVAAYVTKNSLQRRYPPALGAFATTFSDVELPPIAFAPEPRRPSRGRPVGLVLVGSLEQLYKGADLAIDAVQQLASSGADINLVIVGDGKHRRDLEARAAAAGVADRVTFRGQLSSGNAVREELDKADAFLIPSRTEGLPRALIEAMARGLVCIGSNVGGIPELLPPEFLVRPGDATALARRIREITADPGLMAAASVRNLDTAKEYAESILSKRRTEFCCRLMQETEKWLHAR